MHTQPLGRPRYVAFLRNRDEIPELSQIYSHDQEGISFDPVMSSLVCQFWLNDASPDLEESTCSLPGVDCWV
jgi:hypothetical protein